MSEKINYGIRNYTNSEKTKRPQKNCVSEEVLKKRNSYQKRLYITLDNIDEIFSNNQEKHPICYDMIFNLIQGKVTKYFNTRNYDRKKELSYDCINRLYSVLKRKLLSIKDSQCENDAPPVLFFYLSQFFRYVDLLVYSTVFFGIQDQKYLVQEPELFNTEDVLNENYIVSDENIVYEDKSEKIKNFIDSCKEIDAKEKKLLLKIYKNSYSLFGGSLSKKDNEYLSALKQKMIDNPNLLKELEEICYE